MNIRGDVATSRGYGLPRASLKPRSNVYCRRPLQNRQGIMIVGRLRIIRMERLWPYQIAMASVSYYHPALQMEGV